MSSVVSVSVGQYAFLWERQFACWLVCIRNVTVSVGSGRTLCGCSVEENAAVIVCSVPVIVNYLCVCACVCVCVYACV